jgi:hypothetical protein
VYGPTAFLIPTILQGVGGSAKILRHLLALTLLLIHLMEEATAIPWASS